MTGNQYKERVDKSENILKLKIMNVLDNTLKIAHGEDWGERVINKDKAVSGIIRILKERRLSKDDLYVCE